MCLTKLQLENKSSEDEVYWKIVEKGEDGNLYPLYNTGAGSFVEDKWIHERELRHPADKERKFLQEVGLIESSVVERWSELCQMVPTSRPVIYPFGFHLYKNEDIAAKTATTHPDGFVKPFKVKKNIVAEGWQISEYVIVAKQIKLLSKEDLKDEQTQTRIPR